MHMDYCPVRMDYQVLFSDNCCVSKDYNSVSKECTVMRKGYFAVLSESYFVLSL